MAGEKPVRRKDPDSIEPFSINWSDWLNGDTISTSSWTVPAGITLDSDSNDTTTTTAVLSGGTAGNNYEITNRITTALGYQKDQSMVIICKEQ